MTAVTARTYSQESSGLKWGVYLMSLAGLALVGYGVISSSAT